MDTKAYTDTILQELSRTLTAVPPQKGEELADRICQAKRIFTAGAGRSGLAARAFAMRLMHLGYTAYVCGETTTPSLQADDLLLVVSGSGNTATLLCMAEKAKKLGAQLATLKMCIRDRPCTVISLFEEGCISSGRCYFEGGPTYNIDRKSVV